MAINDDIDDDLPAENPEEAGAATFVAAPTTSEEQVPPTETDIFGPAAIEGQIPQVEVELVSTQDILNKASDLGEIKQELVKEGGVNKEDAIAVETIAPGLVNQRFPLAMYTVARSKSNLKRALEQIDSAIDANLSEAATGATALCDSINQAVTNYLKLFEDRYLGLFNENTRALGAILSAAGPFGLLDFNYKGVNGFSIHNFLSMDLDRFFPGDEESPSILGAGAGSEGLKLLQAIVSSDNPDASRTLKYHLNFGNPECFCLGLGAGNEHAEVKDGKVVVFNTSSPAFKSSETEDLLIKYGIKHCYGYSFNLGKLVSFTTGANGLTYIKNLQLLLGSCGQGSEKAKEDIANIVSSTASSDEKIALLLQVVSNIKMLYRVAVAAARELEVLLIVVNSTTHVLTDIAHQTAQSQKTAVTQVA